MSQKDCLQRVLSELSCKGKYSLVANELGPPIGGAFLSIPKDVCAGSYDPAILNDIDTRLRFGQFYSQAECEEIAAQFMCGISGTANKGNVGLSTPNYSNNQKGQLEQHDCFCSIVRACTSQALTSLH